MADDGDKKVCPICNTPSTLACSNCKKVVYCSKEHQKKDRKAHKGQCFPVIMTHDNVLGFCLKATRAIKAGEKILQDAPLLYGPRRNFDSFMRICLGCCDSIDDGEGTDCTSCGWPVCGEACEKNPHHSKFECQVLKKAAVPPASTQDEYFYISFLRCLLLKTVDPSGWEAMLKLEAHTDTRKERPEDAEQVNLATAFIREKCKMTEISRETVDFVYGAIIVNAYGDPNSCYLKLFALCSKLAHACIPNTTTRLTDKGLDVVATLPIPVGTALTQLYGRTFKGTHRRQELLQNVYCFSCTCERCADPTEFGTYFQAIKCIQYHICSGYLLPINPMDVSPSSKWQCNTEACQWSTTYEITVEPTLKEIVDISGMNESEPLYSIYELYNENTGLYGAAAEEGDGDGEDPTLRTVKHVILMLEALKQLVSSSVHMNHYALLPFKTALIATIYSLLDSAASNDAKEKNNKNKKGRRRSSVEDPLPIPLRKRLFEEYHRLVNEVFVVSHVLLPGMTTERGLVLFYLSEARKLRTHLDPRSDNINPKKKKELEDRLEQMRQESLQIMLLEDPASEHRKLVLQHLLPEQ